MLESSIQSEFSLKNDHGIAHVRILEKSTTPTEVLLQDFCRQIFPDIQPTIEHDRDGRPIALGGSLTLTASHSDQLTMIAISKSQNCQLGVDLEGPRNLHSIDRFREIAVRYFPKYDGTIEGFLKLWTQAEAIAKAKKQPLEISLVESYEGRTKIFSDSHRDHVWSLALLPEVACE